MHLIQIGWCLELFTSVYVYRIPNLAPKAKECAHVFFLLLSVVSKLWFEISG